MRDHDLSELTLAASILKEHQIRYVKAGLEFERNTQSQLMALSSLAMELAVPFAVKIGGPDARHDVDLAADAGASIVIAPMVETAYGLQIAREAARCRPCLLGINLETITGVEHLPAMMDSQAWPYVTQVTIGRSDLAGSMGMDNDDYAVSEQVAKIVRLIGERDPSLPVYVGGKITCKNARDVAKMTGLISTRHFGFAADVTDAAAVTQDVLRVEAWFYDYFAAHSIDRQNALRADALATEIRRRACL